MDIDPSISSNTRRIPSTNEPQPSMMVATSSKVDLAAAALQEVPAALLESQGEDLVYIVDFPTQVIA